MSFDGRSPRRIRPTFLGIAAAGMTLALALAACGTTASSGGVAGATASPPASAEAGASTEPSPSASQSTQAHLSFQEANGSKIFGGGILTDLGDGSTAVTIGVVAVGFADPLPAELTTGSCAELVTAPVPSAAASAEASAAASAAPSAAASAEASAGPSVAPTPATLPVQLTDVAAGSSNTVVQLPLADLLSAPTAVVIHESAADATVVACSDVVAGAAAPPAASAPAASMPAESAPAASASAAP